MFEVQKTEYGFVQRASFANPDLLHEEVVELDSPFASLRTSAETAALTFLIVGDQNAGKSTFMHAFVHRDDPRWIDVLCELPILASSFVNARFLPQPQTADAACDEPPFLDTDLARATVLLTRDDFAFLLSERGIARSSSSSSTDAPFVVLQMIEIGGDHLDALAAYSSGGGGGREGGLSSEIAERSLEVLRGAARTAYFVNAHAFDDAAAARMQARLRFLSTVVSAEGHEVDFVVTRAEGDPAAAEKAKAAVNSALLASKPHMRVLGIREASHLTEEGHIHAPGIFDTLEGLLRMGPSSSPSREDAQHQQQQSADAILAPRVLAAAAELGGMVWLTREKFVQCIEHSAGTGAELPATTMLQRFEDVCTALVAQRLLLLHKASGHADIVIQLGSHLVWRPHVADQFFAVRAPRLAQLRAALDPFSRHDVPPEMWFGQQLQLPSRGQEMEQALDQAQRDVQEAWCCVRAAVDHRETTSEEISVAFDAFVSATEDWALCSSNNAHQTMPFPAQLQGFADAGWSKLRASVAAGLSATSSSSSSFSVAFVVD